MYEITSFTHPVSGEEFSSVTVTHEDGSLVIFPVDETNPRYLAFLEETA